MEKQIAEEFDEAEEEEKMNKFYELIRRFKEARDQHQRTLLQVRLQNDHHRHQQEEQQIEKQEQKQEKQAINDQKKVKMVRDRRDDEQPTIPNWMPSFKWDDFGDFHHQDGHDHVVVAKSLRPSSCSTRFTILDNNNNNKKRKMMINVDDRDDDDESYRLKNPRPEIGLDLNLAL